MSADDLDRHLDAYLAIREALGLSDGASQVWRIRYASEANRRAMIAAWASVLNKPS